jgi:isocitrate lyase
MVLWRSDSGAAALYADMIWCDASTPDLGEEWEFAQAIHERHREKLLAYSCPPSFDWRLHHDGPTISNVQDKLGAMGCKFQFATLAGFHALNISMFELAQGYQKTGMSALSRLQEREFELEEEGCKTVKHQSLVGAGFFDQAQMAITGGAVSTFAFKGSTDEEQFEPKASSD